MHLTANSLLSNRVLADKQDSTGEVNHESLVYQ